MTTPAYTNCLIDYRWRALSGLLVLLLGLLLLLAAAGATAQSNNSEQVEVYRPLHRTPASLITTLQPLFDDSATFSSDGRHVIVKAAPATVSSVLQTLVSIDVPLRFFRIQLSDHPSSDSGKVYSTKARSFRNQTFRIMENKTLTLVQERQAQTVNQVAPWWIQVSEQTVQQEALQLSISAVGETLYVQVTIRELNNGQLSSFDQQISTGLDEWVSLYGGAVDNKAHHTVGTRARQQQELYLKISAP